jgi:hypothetical protein
MGATIDGMHLPALSWRVHWAFAAAGNVAVAVQAGHAMQAARRRIMEAALPHVPGPLSDSFLHRDVVNAVVPMKVRPITNQ